MTAAPTLQKSETSTSAAKNRLRAWLHILKVTRVIESSLRDRMRREFDSTLPRFDVLAALFRVPEGLRMSDLSDALMVSNGNVTGIVDRLVEEGQIERVPVANDRRASIVRLTDRGRADFAHRADVHAGWISELLSDLSDDDATTLIDILRPIEHKTKVPQ